MSDHLASCELCRDQLAALEARADPEAQAFRASFALLYPARQEATFHLSDEQVMNYVDQALEEVAQEIATAHLKGCA